MKKHGKFFTANIVLGILLVLAVLFDLSLMLSFGAAMQRVREKVETSGELEPDYGMKSDLTWDLEEEQQENRAAEGWLEGEDPKDYYQWYSILSVEEASLQEIGDSYQGRNADEGNSLYQLTVRIKNSGTMSAGCDETGLDFTWEPGQKVKEWREGDSFPDSQLAGDGAFYIIPPGKTGTRKIKLEISDEVENVTLRYYNNSQEVQEYQVAVP